MKTVTGPGTEWAHVTVFWPMKSCRQMSPGDRSENKKKQVIFTVQYLIITSFLLTPEDIYIGYTSNAHINSFSCYLLSSNQTPLNLRGRWTLQIENRIEFRDLDFTFIKTMIPYFHCFFYIHTSERASASFDLVHYFRRPYAIFSAWSAASHRSRRGTSIKYYSTNFCRRFTK